MKVIKKINNNVVIAIDNNNREVILFGKGLGFNDIPYEVNDLSKIERTYYDVDSKYYDVLGDIPEKILRLTTKLVDTAKQNIKEELNPNLTFTLADHINFAVTRIKKGLNVQMPYFYELEYSYPHLTNIARWMSKNIEKILEIKLDEGEVSSLTMHLINALGGEKNKSNESLTDKTKRIITDVTGIVESHYGHEIDKKSFNYFRFKNHLKYFVQRKGVSKELSNSNVQLFENLKQEYPNTYECVSKIDKYFYEIFDDGCVKEELLYLIVHINRLYINEDCNRKGITP